ncbi:hypothetical protein DIPPA_32796 [Diplonema papillatum]|nr:hypothetical protein DIPPA_32796 [Diplonema papillatum]
MSGVQEIPMKFELARQGEVVETRRRRLVNPSFGVVTKVADELARGRHQLQYVDEDGDVVTMSSQEEWEECVACWDGAQPLRVRVDLCSGARRQASSSSGSGSESDCARRRRKHGSHARRRSTSPSHRRHPFFFLPFLFGRHSSGGGAKEQATADHPSMWMHGGPGVFAGGKGCKGMGHPGVKGMSAGCGKGWKGMHGAGGKGFKGMFGGGCGKGMHGGGCKGMFGGWGNDEAVDAEQVGQKCSNCDFQATGRVDGFCCVKCSQGESHGRHCEQKPFVAPGAEAEEQPGNECPEQCDTEEQPQAEHPFMWMKGGGKGCKGMGHPGMKGMFAGCGKGWKGMHGAGGKGCKGMFGGCGRKEEVDAELIGQKCSNCDFETTGIVDSFCCRACRWGKGHGRWCAQKVHSDTEEPQCEEKEVPQHEGEEAPERAAGVEAAAEPGRCGRRAWRCRQPSAASSGGKCAKCDFKTTGLVDSFCCRRCRGGKGHGKRCKQLPFAEQQPADEPAPAAVEGVVAGEAVAGVPVCDGSTAAPTAVEVDVTSCSGASAPREQPYAAEIARLEDMGFTVTPHIVGQLVASNGNVPFVLNTFLA